MGHNLWRERTDLKREGTDLRLFRALQRPSKARDGEGTNGQIDELKIRVSQDCSKQGYCLKGIGCGSGFARPL